MPEATATASDHPKLARGPYRLEITARMTPGGPMHIGSGDTWSLSTDAPVYRDCEGCAVLPGKSSRGPIRDWCVREAPLVGVAQAALARLFGEIELDGAKSDRQGRLSVLDVRLDKFASEIRDHVRISPEWSAAARGGKFDEEVIYPEAFDLTLVYEGDAWDDDEIVVLAEACDALKNGLIAFGGKTNIGFGAVMAASVEATCFDRSRTDELSSYLLSRLPGAAANRGASVKLPDLLARRKVPLPLDTERPQPWCWLRLRIAIDFDGPTLVGDVAGRGLPGREGYEELDTAHYARPDGTTALPGSGLRGGLGRLLARATKTLGPDAEEVAACLLGFVDEATKTSAKSLLRVGEGKLLDDPPPYLVMEHVAIDRLTSFAAGGRLFDALALASPSFEHEILLRWRFDDSQHEAALGLFFHGLRDLAGGRGRIGRRGSGGYGKVFQVRILPGSAWSGLGPSETWDGPARLSPVKLLETADGAQSALIMNDSGDLKYLEGHPLVRRFLDAWLAVLDVPTGTQAEAEGGDT